MAPSNHSTLVITTDGDYHIFHFGERPFVYPGIIFSLKDLIHGAPINKPVATTASVKAVYFERDGSEITFTRR